MTRDLFFLQENKILGSYWAEHLTGVRGKRVLFLFPLLKIFDALIFFSLPLAFHAQAVNTSRQGLSYSLFYKTSWIRVLDHRFRLHGASIR